MKKLAFLSNALIGFLTGFTVAVLLVIASIPSWHKESTLPAIVSDVRPAVVNIVATKHLSGLQKLFFSEKENTDGSVDIGGGTGFIVSSDGLTVTANHIIKGESYTAVDINGRELTAEVLSQYPEADVALLDLEGEGYPVINLSNSEVLAGENVFAIGNSLGYYKNSVLAGIISALPCTIEKDGYEMTELIQLQMSISNGDSGGPLFNSRGEVIGMLIAFDNRANGISFAVPVDKIKELIK